MKVLHVDENHPALVEGLKKLGFQNDLAYKDNLTSILTKIDQYEGLIIRSRFPVDEAFLLNAKKLKFIGRVGAGMENIDLAAVKKHNIQLVNSPEGNRNAVGEHTLGMLLNLFNKLLPAHQSVQSGKWEREQHRGEELSGKTIGIIGYGNMGKSFSKKLSGFEVNVLCHDLLPNVGDENAQQLALEDLQEKCQVISLHTPETLLTQNIIDAAFIDKMKNPFWLLNTARGSAVASEALVEGLKTGKILGAGLDVLAYESKSFSTVFKNDQLPDALAYLIAAKNVILSPHIAGWTVESHLLLATTIVEKIKKIYF
jgi:D-3-phosphoglycerate dehydrogenase